MVGHLWTALFLIFDVVLLRAEKSVFLEHESATTILGRAKRANPYPFGEFWSSSLESECYEEQCSFEEALEYFENSIETERFWKTYRGNPCFSDPCQNGGRCKQVKDNYECRCLIGTQGVNCEKVIFEYCNVNNGQCEQFCSQSKEEKRVQCSCTSGYTLGADQKSCNPNERFVCGKVYKRSAERSRSASSRSEDIAFGAWLVNKNNQPFCGGTILDQHFVLTAAHCIDENEYFRIVVGEDLKANIPPSTHEVDIVVLHSKFDNKTLDYDIAIVKVAEAIVFNPRALPACIPEMAFAEHVLMTPYYVYSTCNDCTQERHKPNTEQTLPRFRRAKCCQFLNFNSNGITKNMFCASSWNKGVCGFPHVTPYKGTYFVTGITSWQGTCVNGETQLVFTLVPNFVNWIQSIMCNVRNGSIAVV
ncbi:coagulation factor X-like isoform X1 [Pleurodeles waltl]|uniref:coagulation factor X-like isoform X1 n=1 Tax=Pleurodeles waltl TaxID=8319 RepID=UPI003709C1D5